MSHNQNRPLSSPSLKAGASRGLSVRKINLIAVFSYLLIAAVGQADMLQTTQGSPDQNPPVYTVKPADEKVGPHLRKVEVADATDYVERLKAELARQAADIKALREEMASLTEQLKAEKEGKEKVVAELSTLRETLATGGNGKLISLADAAGETVFLRGVGEVVLAAADGKIVLKVPASIESKADKVLATARAEKIARNGYLYYVAPSAALNR